MSLEVENHRVSARRVLVVEGGPIPENGGAWPSSLEDDPHTYPFAQITCPVSSSRAV